jgi:FMN phosphatase YigB (HAD superfamily)
MSKELVKKIKNSFDVFDTCLTRLWADPSDLFVILGQRLQQMGLVAETETDFAEKRRLAELAAWKQSNYKIQPSTAQIYQHLALSMGWDEAASARALATEVQLEVAGVTPVPETFAVIAQLHESGEPVAYISDMYLSEEVIHEMLVKNGFWHPGDQLFVSADAGFRKHNGLLFRHVRQTLRRPPFSIKHTGDNYRADFVMAWLYGFRGLHFNAGLLQPREAAALKGVENAMLGSKLAGLSRVTRLSYQGAPAYKNLWQTATTGFAPLLFSFAFHCLTQAQAEGIADIFFCSRDGRLPMEVAKIINEKYDLGLNIKYLKCSRSAWCKTDLVGPKAIGISTALETAKGLTIREIGKRLDIREEYFEKISAYLGGGLNFDTPLSAKQRTTLVEGFAAGFMQEQLLEIEKQNLDACVKYFEQCGIDFTKKYLVIDAFSRGTIQALFSSILVKTGAPVENAKWAYLELLDAKKRNATNSFLKPSVNAFSRIAIAESLLATNEQSLVAYQLVGSDVELVFDKSAISPAEKMLHDTVHQACLKFARLACENLSLPELDKATLDLYATNAFESLISSPTYSDAKSLQSMPYESWSRKIALAKGLGVRDFLKALRHRMQENKAELILDGPWMQGSMALTDPLTRRLFKMTARPS